MENVSRDDPGLYWNRRTLMDNHKDGSPLCTGGDLDWLRGEVGGNQAFQFLNMCLRSFNLEERCSEGHFRHAKIPRPQP